jgi:hypothetical protein
LQSIGDLEFACLKAEWLKRSMKTGSLVPSHRLVAYFLVDCLNWATMDCWPSHERLAEFIGASSKTVQRSLSRLEERNLLAVYRRAGSSNPLRYAPIYLATGKRDIDVWQSGHRRLETADIGVHQPFLCTLPESSLEAAAGRTQKQNQGGVEVLPFKFAERGRIENQIAPLFGGFDVLWRLAAIHDGTITRLCMAHQTGRLGPREIKAAKLAAAQSQFG